MSRKGYLRRPRLRWRDEADENDRMFGTRNWKILE
jgi:hypothetical protein